MSGAVEKLLFIVKQIPPTDSWHQVDSDRCNFHPLMPAWTLVSLLERYLVLELAMPRTTSENDRLHIYSLWTRVVPQVAFKTMIYPCECLKVLYQSFISQFIIFIDLFFRLFFSSKVHHSFGSCGSTFGDPYLRQNPFKRHKTTSSLFAALRDVPLPSSTSSLASQSTSCTFSEADAGPGGSTELDLSIDGEDNGGSDGTVQDNALVDEVQFPGFPVPREAGVQRAACLAAASALTPVYDPGKITVWDLFDALQNDPGCLPTYHIRYLATFASAMRMKPVPWSWHEAGAANVWEEAEEGVGCGRRKFETHLVLENRLW